NDQRADPDNQKRKQPRQTIKAEDEIDPERRQPGNLDASSLRPVERYQTDEPYDRDSRREGGGSITRVRRQPGGNERAHKWQADQGEKHKASRHEMRAPDRRPTPPSSNVYRPCRSVGADCPRL